jgi:hypothetical protein
MDSSNMLKAIQKKKDQNAKEAFKAANENQRISLMAANPHLFTKERMEIKKTPIKKCKIIPDRGILGNVHIQESSEEDNDSYSDSDISVISDYKDKKRQDPQINLLDKMILFLQQYKIQRLEQNRQKQLFDQQLLQSIRIIQNYLIAENNTRSNRQHRCLKKNQDHNQCNIVDCLKKSKKGLKSCEDVEHISDNAFYLVQEDRKRKRVIS